MSTDIGLPDSEFTGGRGETSGFHSAHEALHPKQFARLPNHLAFLIGSDCLLYEAFFVMPILHSVEVE